MASPSNRCEVAVIGLGLIGAAALRHLAQAGVDVVGIGPGEPTDWSTHTGVFASHYDSGRITRKLDTRFEWAELARRSIASYGAIEEASGIRFHHPAGALLASQSAEHIATLTDVGQQAGADFRVLGSAVTGLPTLPDGRVAMAADRLALPPGSIVVAEAAPAGFIDPRRMLQAQLRCAVDAGAVVVDQPAASTEPVGAGWRVATASGAMVEARLVLVATGAHTDELGVASRFEGVVRPETVVLASLDAAEQQRLAGIPSVLAHLIGSSFADLYQVPPTEYPGGTIRLKLGATLRSWEPLATADDRRRWMSGSAHEQHLDELRGLAEDLVPGIRATAWTTKPCMITDTPSGLPTIDHAAPSLVIAAGGNGYAAKSADAIGALAATLLSEGRWTDPILDRSPFALPNQEVTGSGGA